MAATISTKNLVWIPASCGESVCDAVVAGCACDGEELHVVRMHHEEEFAVGKLHIGHSHAYVAYYGREHSHEEYEVLANPGGIELEWKEACNGEIPTGAIEAGHCEENEPIYVARCSHEEDVVPAKLVSRVNCAFVPWGGKEHPYKEYEVLCVKYVKPEAECC